MGFLSHNCLVCVAVAVVEKEILGLQSKVARALDWVPVTGIDQALRVARQWIDRRIDLGILARFRMTVSEHDVAPEIVPRNADAFLVCPKRADRRLGPPSREAVKAGGFRILIAQ